MALLSILGLYNYDNTIFDSIVLPIGGDVVGKKTVRTGPDSTIEEDITVPPVDFDMLKDTILLELGELEFIYQNPDFAKTAINLWSRTRKNAWERLHKTAFLQYKVIENYDRYENITDEESGESRSESGLIGTTENDSNGSSTSKAKSAAFNSPTLYEHENGENSGTSHSATTMSNTGTVDGTNKRTNKRETHIHGNIGVTTAQQMINEERKLQAFDIYKHITQEFKERFCVMVY
jgi:hypothetical protein